MNKIVEPDEFRIYSIRELSPEFSHNDVDVMGIISKCFHTEPKLCKGSTTKYFISFTIKGIRYCLLICVKV